MTKEKTIREWLETLPDGYRERALRNLKAYSVNALEGSLYWALSGAFQWIRSPERYDFWRDVQLWTIGKGELPPLPELLK